MSGPIRYQCRCGSTVRRHSPPYPRTSDDVMVCERCSRRQPPTALESAVLEIVGSYARFDYGTAKLHVTASDTEVGLTFEMLAAVADAAGTRNIDVESTVEHGYYDDIDGEIRLTIEWPGGDS